MIRSQIDFHDVISSINAYEYRYAYDWLIIEKAYKGQKWFVKKSCDRGQVLIEVENGSLWVFISDYEITLNKSEANLSQFNSENLPMFVKMLRFEDKRQSDIPKAVKKLYEDVYSEVAVGEVMGV